VWGSAGRIAAASNGTSEAFVDARHSTRQTAVGTKGASGGAGAAAAGAAAAVPTTIATAATAAGSSHEEP